MSNLQGISPRLPLVYNSTDGPYQLNKVLTDAMRQNLKMLILTAPGERIMIPEFGVGLHRYLFEQMTSSTFSTVSQKINEQVERYIPAINLEEVMFVTSDEDPSLGLNDVRTVIKYNILPFAGTDQLIITTTMTN